MCVKRNDGWRDRDRKRERERMCQCLMDQRILTSGEVSLYN